MKRKADIQRSSAGLSAKAPRRLAAPAPLTFQSLPLELKHQIATNLSISDVGSLRATCRQSDYEFYAFFVKRLLGTPKFAKWFATTRDDRVFRINWTDAGLQWATFVLGNKKVSEHVTHLIFPTRDFKITWYADCVLYSYSFVPHTADWSIERKLLEQNEARYAEYLERILSNSPNAHDISLQTSALWPMDTGDLAECTERWSDVQELHEYMSSEEAMYDAESIAQAFTTLMIVLAKIGKRVDSLKIHSDYDYRQVSFATVEEAMAHVLPAPLQKLTKLRSLELSMEQVEYSLTYETLSAADRACPNLSEFFGRSTQIEDLTLESTFDGFIPPKVMDSMLLSMHSQSLTRVTLMNLLAHQKTLASFLKSHTTVRRLALSAVSVVHGTWKPLLEDLLERVARAELHMSCRTLFELTPNGHYVVAFSSNTLFRDISYDSRISGYPEILRFEDGLFEWFSRPSQIHIESASLSIGAALWAGIYFAKQNDALLEYTREIRTWD
ncbi:hypothetical protein HDK77DRAFT_478510 [Phyllosticta capitalensis]